MSASRFLILSSAVYVAPHVPKGWGLFIALCLLASGVIAAVIESRGGK